VPNTKSFLRIWTLTSLLFGAGSVLPLNANIIGTIDGVFGATGAQYIQGWACEVGNPAALTINIYTGGGAGSGWLYAGAIANSPSDSGVQSACGTTTGHRFYVNATGDMFLRGGQTIYIYALGTASSPTILLPNSGNYTVPNGTTPGNLDSLTAGGVASGWVFDSQNSSASLTVYIYIDGQRLAGAETGSFLTSTTTNIYRGDVNAAYHITGNHGFSVQLPASATQGVHTISIYPVDNGGGLGSPINGSPQVPGGTNVSTSTSLTISSGGEQGWSAYSLPGSVNLVALSGTVTMTNSASYYAETLFFIEYLPSGSCTSGTSSSGFGPPGSSKGFWTTIIKAPTSGTYSAPVNFTVPAGIPISNCLIVGLNPAIPSSAHSVTATMNIVATYTTTAATRTSYAGLGGEVAHAITGTGNEYASRYTLSQASTLNAIWGNIGDSTYDPNFNNIPSGSWTVNNDVYIYRGSDCTSSTYFPGTWNGPVGLYGPADFSDHIPPDAVHLISAPLSGSGEGTAVSINYLLKGLTTGQTVFQTFSNTLNAQDCLVSIFRYTGSSGSQVDSENQLNAIITAN
jgi:hypothetical protein